MKKILVSLLAATAVGYKASASLLITAATGGTGISADTAANAPSPSWTTLGTIQVRENNGHKDDFGAGNGSFELTAPAGFEFNAGVGSASAVTNNDINGVLITVSSSSVMVGFSTTGTSKADTLNITGLQVRPTAATPLAANGNITLGPVSNATFGNSPTFGALTEVAGSPTALVIQTQPSTNATSATAFAQQPVVNVVDQFGNISLTNNSAVVSASINSGTGSLVGTTNVTAVNGVATFTDLGPNAPSVITILFSSGSLTSAVSGPVDVSGPPTPSALVIQTEPSTSATAGVAFAQQPVIAIYDQYGAPFTNDNSTVVTAARFDGAGTLQGTTTATAVNGIATFTDLFHTVATNITIRFTAGLLSSATSGTIAVAPAAADHIAFTTQPANAVAGLAFGTQPVVAAFDLFNNPSSVGLPANLDLTLTLTTGTGPLNGTATIDIGTSAGNGVASFSGLSIAAVDATNQLTATAGAFTPVASDVFAVVPQVAAQLVITTQPSSNAVAGVAFAQQPVVQVRDALGNLVSSDNSTVVHVARGTGTGALVGTVDVTVVNGVATFTDLSYNLAQTITLVFSSGALTNATSDSVVVSAAPADHLAFTTQPAGGYAGSAFLTQPAIITRDAFGNNSTVGLAGNQIIAVALTSGTGALIGTTNVDIGTNGGNGSFAFSDLGVSAAGQGKVITASSVGFTNAVSAAFNIGGVEPSNANVSSDTSVTGFAVIPDFTYYEAQSGDVGIGAITLTPPAGYEFVAGGSGGTQQQALINKIGGGGSTGNINNGGNHQVIPLSVSTTAITFNVSSTSSGGKTDSITWHNVRIRALSNVSTNGIVTKSAGATLNAVTDGVTAFVNVQTVGGAAVTLEIQTQPSTNALVGVAFAQQPVLVLKDQFGAISGNDNTTVVTATRNLGTGSLQGTTTATAVNGVVTFTNLSYNIAEAITIDFSAGVLPVVTSDTIQVGAGVVDHLIFSVQPGSAVVGLPFGVQPVVKTVDAFGNPSTGGLNSNQFVNITLSSGSGALLGNTLVDLGTSAGNGTATFTDLAISALNASAQLTATAVESGITAAVSDPFAVTEVPDHLVYVQGDAQSATVGTAVALNPTVQVVDTNGAPIVGATVAFNVTSGGGNIGASTVVTDTNGWASTSWTLGSVAGANTLDASVVGVGAPTNITFTATATSGAGVQLVIATQPSTNAVAGVAFATQPVVQVQDAFGNVMTSDNSTIVHVARGTGTAALQGTVDVTVVSGVATFTDLSYNVAETITLVFSSGVLTNATSDSIVVAPAVADRLAFTTQPAGGYANNAFLTQPVVVTRDQFGNNSTVGLTANQSLTVALTSGSGSLIGTTTVDIGTSAGNGVATFTDLAITAAGAGKVITASSGSLTNAVSAAFTVGGVDPAIANISADTAVSGFTAITGPTYYEAQSGDVGVGTITLTAPAGYEFDTGGAAPTVRIQKSSGPGNSGNIQGTGSPSGGANNAVWPVTSVTATEITFTVTSSSSIVTDTLTWQNIRMRALVGSPLGSGIVTNSGTAVLAAVTNGVTSFANVQTVGGAAAQLVIQTQPSTNAAVGVPFAQQPVILVEDQFGNLASSDNSTVVTAVRNLGMADLQGTTNATAVNGVVTFTNLSYNVAEAITISFTSGVFTPVTSDVIQVGAGIATRLVFVVEPGNAVVGFPFGSQPVIRTVDAYGNFTTGGLPGSQVVDVGLNLGSGLAGTTSKDIGTNFGNGQITFTDLQINVVGQSNQLVAVAEESSISNAYSAIFPVSTVPDHIVLIQGDGQTGIVGSTLAVNPTVQVVDTNGAPIEGATVSFSVLSGGGTVASSSITDTNGYASTTWTLGSIAGTNTMEAKVFGIGVPTNIVFTAFGSSDIGAQLVIIAQPSSTATAGVPFVQQPVVQIQDQFGNVVTTDTNTIVTATRGTGTAALQGTTALTVINGVVTFTNLSYNKAETIDIVFSAQGMTNATSSNIVVSAAAATQLAFTTEPGSARTDSILNPQPVVEAQDQFGNASSNGLPSSLTLGITLSTGTGSLIGTTNIDIGTAAANGVATFTNLQITAAGLNKQLTASANNLSNAVSATFMVGGVDPAIIPTVPANGSSVAATGPTYYELASGDVQNGTIILNAPVGYQFDISSTPTVTVKRIGGSGGPVNNINGANNGANGSTFAVTSFTATQITFTVTNPSTNGVTDSITWNNIKVQAAVGIPSAPSLITKTGTSSMAAVVNGVTSFGEIIGDPRPVQLVIQTQPSSTANAGIAFAQQPVVLVKDQFGNLWTNSSVNVTATRGTGTAALQGTTTVGSVNGVATFTDLSYNVAESITIDFSGTLLVGATSSGIVVGPGTANTLVFSTQPGGAVLGSALNPQPVIKTQDQFGNDSTFGLGTNVNVTLTLTSGTGSLVGTNVLNIGTSGGNGVVTFSGLTVNAAGIKQLTASASSFTDAVSTTFTIDKADQIITFGPLADKVLGDAPFTVGATNSSGLPVTFAIVSGPATIAGSTITVTNTGLVVVSASNAGNSDYNPASVQASFTVSASAVPVINTQPQDLTVIQGSNATFSVTASGPALTYQWLFNGTNLVGATDSSLTITNAQGSNAGIYAVVVSNSTASVTSSNATLTVILPPQILSQPTNATAGDGDDFSLPVSSGAGFVVSGTQPFTYQWQKNGNNLSTQTNSALSLLNVNPGDAGDYTVVLANAAGSVTSAPISLTVISVVAPAITVQPVDQTVQVGSNALFSVTATGTLLNYQWRVNGTNIPNANSSSLLISPVSLADAGVYSVIVSNSAGIAISSNATLTVTTITNDIDVDGHVDLLIQTTNNLLALWNLNGTNFFNSFLLNDGVPLTAGWRVAAQADFNHDGKTDFVLQNGGFVTIWLMDGTNLVNSVQVNTKAFSKAWKVVAAKDFNHDGSIDLVFQHDGGYQAVWFMNGTTLTRAVLLRGGAVVPTSWKLVGVDDFNDDGNPDFLWQNNNNGNLVVWYMNGIRLKSTAKLGVGLLPSQGWHIVGLVDLNGDNTRDILWQNTDGRLFTWFLDGVNTIGSNILFDGNALPAGATVVGEK